MEIPSFEYPPVLAYASNHDIRYKASSGGVITAIINYLFAQKKIDCAISLEFNSKKYYEPKIVHSFSDYNISGSVYHEIEIIRFLNDNLNKIGKTIFITCCPCQVLPIKTFLTKNNKNFFIVSFVCSSQLKPAATDFLLKKLRIEKEDINNLQYRGNGWPSGIKIRTNNKEYYIPNLDSLWSDIYHSLIFNLNKCFFCQDTFGKDADLVVADPWFSERLVSDKLGSTVVIARTESAQEVLSAAVEKNYLFIEKRILSQAVIDSQKFTLVKKYIFRKYHKLFNLILKIIRSNFYQQHIFIKFHRWHYKRLVGLIQFLYARDK